MGFMYPEGLRAGPCARLSASAPVSTTLCGRCHQQAHLRSDDAEAWRKVSHLVGEGGGYPPPLWPSQRQARRGPSPLARCSLHSPPALRPLSCLDGPWGNWALLPLLTSVSRPLLAQPSPCWAHRPLPGTQTLQPSHHFHLSLQAEGQGPGAGRGGTSLSECTPRLPSALAAQPSCDLTPMLSTFSCSAACGLSLHEFRGGPPGRQPLLQDEPTSRLCLHPAFLSRGWTPGQPVVSMHPQ